MIQDWDGAKSSFTVSRTTAKSGDLIPIKVQVVGKGTFAYNSMICWPSESDLNLILNSTVDMEVNGIQLNKSDLRPQERHQEDENLKTRNKLSADHKKEKIQLRRKWKRLKEKISGLSVDALEKNGDSEDKIKDLKKNLKALEDLRSQRNVEYNQQMEKLLGLDDFDTVRGSASRPIMGYLNMAGTCYRLGSKPFGLGYVSSKAQEQYYRYFNDKFGFKEFSGKIKAMKKTYGITFDSQVIVLVRRPSSESYSYAIMEMING